MREALPKRVMDVAHPRIGLDQDEHDLIVKQSHSRDAMLTCLTSIFEVGILCSDENPQKRIDMGVALKKLLVARDQLLQQ